MARAEVVAAGWHDTYFRWDISTPQRLVARLEALSGHGTLRTGKKLFAERNRFGKWQHLLGPQHVLLAYTVDSPTHGVIRRLEVQAHLGDSGEDDLCAVAEFAFRWRRLQLLMADCGVLPVEEPRYVRVDSAVDVVYEDPQDGHNTLEALRYARWPRGWHAEYQGAPPYTTVAIKKGTKTLGRAYCRNTKLKNGGQRWGKIRFEAEQRFNWREARPVSELENPAAAQLFWQGIFGPSSVAGRITRIAREVQAVELAERVATGQITTAQYEQMSGFLDAERLGLVTRIYRPETARRRRALAMSLGIASADAETERLDFDLDRLLGAPRRAWAA